MTANADLRRLHEALMDLMGIFNAPQRDDALIAEAGIALDRALFPLLVRIERRGPIGVVDLASLAGRDHTTVSRQVAKLEELGLVRRQAGKSDKRLREAAITRKGLAMTRAIDKARERIAGPILAGWSEADRQSLIRLVRRLVDDIEARA
ncbi:MAG: MarR family transcriptional regulator [Rhizomicrobium sp.]